MLKILIATLLLLTSALAQEQPSPPKQPPEQQAIAQALMDEISKNVQLRAELIRAKAACDAKPN